MTELENWLDSIGMVKFISGLRLAGVTMVDELFELNESDLKELAKEMGMNLLTRRRFINAIEQLAQNQGKHLEHGSGSVLVMDSEDAKLFQELGQLIPKLANTMVSMQQEMEKFDEKESLLLETLDQKYETILKWLGNAHKEAKKTIKMELHNARRMMEVQTKALGALQTKAAVSKNELIDNAHISKITEHGNDLKRIIGDVKEITARHISLIPVVTLDAINVHYSPYFSNLDGAPLAIVEVLPSNITEYQPFNIFSWEHISCENCNIKDESWLYFLTTGTGLCSPAVRYGEQYIELIIHRSTSAFWFGLVAKGDPSTLQWTNQVLDLENFEVAISFDGTVYRNGMVISNTHCSLNSGDRIGFAIDMNKKSCRIFLNNNACGMDITDMIGEQFYFAASNNGGEAEYELNNTPKIPHTLYTEKVETFVSAN